MSVLSRSVTAHASALQVPNPQVDQSKTKNIEAGNISNQNGEPVAERLPYTYINMMCAV